MASGRSEGRLSGGSSAAGRPWGGACRSLLSIEAASLRHPRPESKSRHTGLSVFLSVTVFCVLLCSERFSVTGVQFEDEAGINDWLSEQVGPVLHLLPKETPVSSHTPHAEEGSSFVVGTSHGVIAAFNEEHGTLTWRRVNDESDRIERLERHGRFLVAVIHSTPLHGAKDGGRSRVCVYLETDGSFQWAAENDALDFAVSTGGHQESEPLIAISYGSGVEVRRLKDGALIWTAGREGTMTSSQSVKAAVNGVGSVVGLWAVAGSDIREAVAVLYIHTESGTLRVRALAFGSGEDLEDISLDLKVEKETIEIVRGSPGCIGILSGSSGTSPVSHAQYAGVQ